MRAAAASLLRVAAAAAIVSPGVARAALPPGYVAPPFVADASLGGHEFRFSLADALKRGPVVLYFYPAAFTRGCTIEAHDFADAIDDYHKLGATVIGVSTDRIATLDRFSVSECRSKFPVAADPDEKITTAYRVVLFKMTSYANRTSYVIAPDGRVLFVYSSMDPDRHVAKTLAALRAFRAGAPPAKD